MDLPAPFLSLFRIGSTAIPFTLHSRFRVIRVASESFHQSSFLSLSRTASTHTHARADTHTHARTHTHAHTYLPAPFLNFSESLQGLIPFRLASGSLQGPITFTFSELLPVALSPTLLSLFRTLQSTPPFIWQTLSILSIKKPQSGL